MHKRTSHCRLLVYSLSPVGNWPETLPTAEKKNRSPRNTEKSVSMAERVCFPPGKVFFVRVFLRLQSSQSFSLVCYHSSWCCVFRCSILWYLRFLAFRFLRALVDTTLCFTRRERESEKERKRRSG